MLSDVMAPRPQLWPEPWALHGDCSPGPLNNVHPQQQLPRIFTARGQVHGAPQVQPTPRGPPQLQPRAGWHRLAEPQGPCKLSSPNLYPTAEAAKAQKRSGIFQPLPLGCCLAKCSPTAYCPLSVPGRPSPDPGPMAASLSQ